MGKTKRNALPSWPIWPRQRNTFSSYYFLGTTVTPKKIQGRAIEGNTTKHEGDI